MRLKCLLYSTHIEIISISSFLFEELITCTELLVLYDLIEKLAVKWNDTEDSIDDEAKEDDELVCCSDWSSIWIEITKRFEKVTDGICKKKIGCRL